eukprot:2038345-Pleurochrysis_carterae.AAC.2
MQGAARGWGESSPNGHCEKAKELSDQAREIAFPPNTGSRIKQRRVHVEKLDGRFNYARRYAGHGNHEWDVRVMGHDRVLAPASQVAELPPMVAEKNHEGRVRKSALVEPADQPSDLGVNKRHRRCVCL